MTTETYLILSAIMLGFVALGFLINKKLSEITQKKDDSTLMLLNQNMQGMHARLDKAAEVIGSLQRELGVFQEMGRSMQELQDLLKAPKSRGNIGEQVLKSLLSDVLPKSKVVYQHSFKSGEKVDAAIFTKNGIIPIDSKFPMENFLKFIKAKNEESRKEYEKLFNRDFKKHVDDIAKKYILPAEGTMDFAIMYLPNEGAYREVKQNEALSDYTNQKKVYPVGPDEMFYFLRVLFLAFESEEISQTAKEVLGALRGIQTEAKKFGEDLSVLNRHITNAKNMMESVNSSFLRLNSKIENTGQLQGEKTKQISNSSETSENNLS